MSELPKGVGGRYHRVSTAKQDTDRQAEDVDRWLKRQDLTTSHLWEDHESRDKSEQRYDFQRMLGAVRAHSVDWVVIQTLDRLGFKDTYELFAFINTFRENNVQLWSASDNVCLSQVDDARVLMNAVAGQTSTREQVEKGNRAQTTKIRDGKKGLYQGGLPPYGLDVVCYSGEREKWRFVMGQANRRVTSRKPTGGYAFSTTIAGFKVENGLETPCSRVPRHEDKEVVRLAPTIRTDRLDTIRRIYLLLDTEATNPCQICDKLNAEGVPPTVGDLWTDSKIRHLVTNPAYLGLPASHKGGQPRFFDFRGGELTKLESRGKAKHVRRPRSEWVQPPEPIFPPIVSPERWEGANRRIAAKGKRAPKTDELYLAGLVYCSKCGQRMPGSMIQRRSKRDNSIIGLTPYYQCGTRNKFGRNNPTGCAFHATRHDQLEGLISKFLADRGQNLDDLLSKERDQSGVEQLLRERSSHDADARAILGKMSGFVRSNVEAALAAGLDYPGSGLTSETIQVALDPETPTPETEKADGLIGLYYLLLDMKAERLYEQLHHLETEHATLVEKALCLTAPGLLAKVNQRATEVEAKIASTRAELEPLGRKFDDLLSEMRHLRERLGQAELAMLKGSNRLKAAALRSCIDRIEVTHRVAPSGKSTLVSVTIIPQVGEPQKIVVDPDPDPDPVFPNDGTDLRAIVRELLSMFLQI